MTTPDAHTWDLIRTRLEHNGHMIRGITRRARATNCRCGAPTITGLDADRCALLATVDPRPLTPTGEALAHIAGRNTWTLHQIGNRLQLDYRDHWAIRATPANGTTRPLQGPGHTAYDVMAQHVCGTQPPWPATASRIAHNTHHLDLTPGLPAPF